MDSWESWREMHQTEHTRMWEVLEKVRDRLPVWAVFLISFLTAGAGVLATMLVK